MYCNAVETHDWFYVSLTSSRRHACWPNPTCHRVRVCPATSALATSAAHRIAQPSQPSLCAVPLIPFLSSLVVPISAASGLGASASGGRSRLFFSLLVVSYPPQPASIPELSEDRGDGHTFAIDIFISTVV